MVLAAGGESDDEAEEEAGEQVGKEEFLLVTRSMLQKAQEQRDLLQQAMQRGCVDCSCNIYPVSDILRLQAPNIIVLK